jgi:hypothetical protein
LHIQHDIGKIDHLVIVKDVQILAAQPEGRGCRGYQATAATAVDSWRQQQGSDNGKVTLYRNRKTVIKLCDESVNAEKMAAVSFFRSSWATDIATRPQSSAFPFTTLYLTCSVSCLVIVLLFQK